MQQAGIWRGGRWGRPPASAPAPCWACTPPHTPAPSPHLQNGDRGVISRLTEMIFVKEPGWSLTSIKQFTLLSCHDSREQDSPTGRTGVPGGPLPLAGGVTRTLRLLITICLTAMSFASCISLYLPKTHEYSPLSRGTFSPPRGSRKTARLDRRGFTFKVSFPLVESSFLQPSCPILPSHRHT